MPPEIILRRATIDDAERVSDIYLESRKKFVSFAPLAHTNDEVRHWVRTILIPVRGVTVASRANTIVGVLSTSKDKTTNWIDQLYIDPTLVNSGIGSVLIQEAKLRLGNPIRLWTFQANNMSRKFYEKHGFRAIQYTNGENNEEKCPDVLYEWDAQQP